MTDISYLSEFLSKLFNISHEDYVVETVCPNAIISENDMTEGETIEDIELAIADIMKEMSESGAMKNVDKEMQLKSPNVSVVQFQDSQSVTMVDIVKKSRTTGTRMLKAECQVYVKDPHTNTKRNDYIKDEYTDPDINGNEDSCNANDINEQYITKKCWVGLRKLDSKEVEKILVGSKEGVYEGEKEGRKSIQIERSSVSGDNHDLEFEDSAHDKDEDPCVCTYDQDDVVSKKCWVGISKLDPQKVQMFLNGKEMVLYDGASIKNIVQFNQNVPATKEDANNRQVLEFRCADFDLENKGLGIVSATDTDDGNRISVKARDPVAGIIGNVELTNETVEAAEDAGTTVAEYPDENIDTLSEEVNKESMHEMVILDEIQEDSNTTSTLEAIDDEDFENFLNYCKEDHYQARGQVSKGTYSVKKKPKNLKDKLKKVAKTVFKKIRVPNHKHRVKTVTGPAVKAAFGTSSPGPEIKLEKVVGSTMKDVTIKGNSEDVNNPTTVDTKKDVSESKSSLYSDNILNNFFNPKQSLKKKGFLYKIPKLPRVCSTQNKESKDNDVVVKGRELVSAKKTPIYQMEMVNKEKNISKLLPACSTKNEKSKENNDMATGLEPIRAKKSSNEQMVMVNKEMKDTKVPQACTTQYEKRKENDDTVKESKPTRAIKSLMDVVVYKERNVPKLSHPLYGDMGKGGEHTRAKKSLIDQMVMVDKEKVTLGTFLTNEGIIPGVDVRKLMVSEMETKGDGIVRDKRVLKMLPMDKEELDDIYHKNWETMKKITTDEERQKLSRIAFENRVPANPGNNLTYHGYRAKGRYHEGRSYRHHQHLGPIFPTGSVAIKQGKLEPLPGYKRKYREYEVDRREGKRRKIEYKNFSIYMKSLYFEKYKSKMKGEEISQGLFEDFQYFMKHVNNGQEETENFLSFYSNKAVMMDDVQVDEVSDTENMFSSFKVFYGKSDVAKCTSCGTYHLFSQ